MNIFLTQARGFLAAAFMVMAIALQASTYHVAPSGNDSNDGTSVTPFLTIQRGINAASAGDLVLVAPGTYATGTQTTTPASGFSRIVITNDIIVRSTAGAAQTVIKGQSDPTYSTPHFGAECVRCVYMTAGTLDGFTLEDGYANATAEGTDRTNPVRNGGGVYTPDNNRAPQVNNCIITRCGAYRGGGAHWATLNNCTVVSNYVNTTSGVGVFSCHVRNSIVMFNGANNDENYCSAADSVDQSLFISSCTSPALGLNHDDLTRDGGNNLITDPLFNEGTFTLSGTSPCINAGNSIYASGALDAAGGARIQGWSVDMGAYERTRFFSTLSVINGTGSGTYSNSTIVSIGAYATNAWFRFSGWTGRVDTVARTSSANTTLVMPESNITVVATYQLMSISEYLSKMLGLSLPVTTANINLDDVDPSVPEVALGNIGDHEAAFFSCVYTNAGTLLFPWRVSSEANHDRLALIIDDIETKTISGDVSGIVTQYIAGIGAHTIRWEYAKDGSDDDLSDKGWVGAVTWIPEPLSAELGVSGQPIFFPKGQPGAPLPSPYGYEACFLDNNAPAGANNGDAVKLGGLDADGRPFFADASTNSVEVILTGAGQLTFNWCASNQISDAVICTIDGVEVARTSGKDQGWITFSTVLQTTGNHVVRWSYTKNASGFGGADAVWIDNVTWIRATFTLTVENGSGGGVYAVGETVTVTAAPALSGKEFDVWDGDTESVADVTAPMTTLVMPARDLTVTALYKSQTLNVTVVNGYDAGAWPNEVDAGTGEPEGIYPARANVRIVANPAPLWYAFDKWTASDSAVAFSNDWDEISSFVLSTNDVTITATYRPQTEAEKLAGALTIRGQPLSVTDFSPSGVVAVATGGIRYDDPVVKMGGPSGGPKQSVYLSTTNFIGNGILSFWWHGDTEEDVDGFQLEVNGSPYFYDIFSSKDTNTVDDVRIWWGGHIPLAGVTNITWRYKTDSTYTIHQNMVLLDRVIWIPQDMVNALGTGACVPNINAEYDPLFKGRDLGGNNGYEMAGEDGGIAWVHDAPGDGDAVRLGRFGYVTNNLFAQVAFTNFGTGILTWQWTAKSEGVYDTLGFYIDGIKTNWISGKIADNVWYTTGFYVKQNLLDAKKTTMNICSFRYQKDNDVSILDDCGWLRNVRWTATHKLIVNKGNIASSGVGETGYFAEGQSVTIIADTPETGYYFDQWTGDDAASLGAAVTDQTATFQMPNKDITLTATYTTTAPVIPHYALTVENGTGDGSYTSGMSVPITATVTSEWLVFAGWTGDTNTVDNPYATSTTILIGTNDLTVTASFISMPLGPIIQTVLGIPAPVTCTNISVDNISLDQSTVTLGPIGDLETAFFTTVYTNAGTVMFPWSVDSEEGYDFLTFSVDGTNRYAFTGSQSGIVTNFITGDGPHLVCWAYSKDSSDDAGTDSATIGTVTWIPDTIGEELGTSGKTPYLPDGIDAILLDEAPPSGAIDNLALRLGGTDLVPNDTSVTIGTVFSGSGKLSFHWRTSSEQSHDYLILMVDGTEAARISGTKTGWLLFETNLLTVADHRVQWIYSKDVSGTSGSDCGWIDSVIWDQFRYTATVQNGTGSGTYAVGESVALTAVAAPAGMEFDEWDGDIETLADSTASTTTFIMPSRDIMIRALYRQATLTVTVINGYERGAWPNAIHESIGEPEGSYSADAEIRIVANEAPLWQTFAYWVSTNGAVFADTNASITTFTMPSNSVTVTAVYRPQTAAEKLAGALTIAGQPLAITSFSSNGIAAESSGGVRYNDPVVKFGGPSVGAGESVELTTTNFTGDGVLLLWCQGGAEAAYDGLAVLVNGTQVNSFSRKCNEWWAMTNHIVGATSITLRFSRDSSYYVRDNTITIDRMIWIPQAMIDATGCNPCIPEVNGEASLATFDGEDGGVSWVNDAPDGNSAIRFGRFGYVDNNEHAKLVVTNYSTGILMWKWASNNEADADYLNAWLDYNPANTDEKPKCSISGKESVWGTGSIVVKNGTIDRDTARKTCHTFLFDYTKDQDVSIFEDCAWLREGFWTPSSKLTLEAATCTSYIIPSIFAGLSEVIEDAKDNMIFPAGTLVDICPQWPAGSYAFAGWEGDVYAFSNYDETVLTNRLVIPPTDITLRARFVAISVTPAPAANAKATIMALSISPSVTPTLKTVTGSTASVGTVSLLFEGDVQTNYAIEWTPSLDTDNASWQPLSVIYRKIEGPISDGRSQIRLNAEIPANVPQGFFRVKAP